MQPQEPIIEATDTRFDAPEQQAERNENAGRVREAIAALAEGSRVILSLHYTGGLTLREVASAMNLAEGTVKSRLNSALNQLRGILQ
jgi:RNA polymerase sigma-70 factor (ECF subfamily)